MKISELQLAHLLDGQPVDLARIGNEMRARPALQSLVMRLANSLDLLSVRAGSSLDQCVAALGADRLRVVVYMWSRLPLQEEPGSLVQHQPRGRNLDAASLGQKGSLEPEEDWNPEALYLASFLKCLALDSPDSEASGDRPMCFAAALQAGDLADLRDILIQDFFSLIPILHLENNVTLHAFARHS